MTETYQGGNASFAPPEYMQKLRAWCDRQQALLIFDEVQAGFGRTGKFWGFEHYGVTPDLICCGKGISSGLPLSAVIGRQTIMDMYPPGSMTSTHTGNPICAAAVLANVRVIVEEGLVEHSRRMGEIFQPELRRIGRRFQPAGSARSTARGWWPRCTWSSRAGSSRTPPWPATSCGGAIEKGLMMFAPVGYGGASVKIAPPLIIPEERVAGRHCRARRGPGGGAAMNSSHPQASSKL